MKNKFYISFSILIFFTLSVQVFSDELDILPGLWEEYETCWENQPCDSDYVPFSWTHLIFRNGEGFGHKRVDGDGGGDRITFAVRKNSNGSIQFLDKNSQSKSKENNIGNVTHLENDSFFLEDGKVIHKFKRKSLDKCKFDWLGLDSDKPEIKQFAKELGFQSIQFFCSDSSCHIQLRGENNEEFFTFHVEDIFKTRSIKIPQNPHLLNGDIYFDEVDVGYLSWIKINLILSPDLQKKYKKFLKDYLYFDKKSKRVELSFTNHNKCGGENHE